MAVRKLFFFLCLYICCTSNSSNCVLDQYIPSVGGNERSRDDLIVQYYNLGFSQMEIIGFLLLCHGIRLSLRQLKRILAKKGLRRRGNASSLDEVVNAIELELQGSGSCIGYRAMWQRLVVDHRLTVSKETVREAIKIIDPEGVENRSKHRLQRRQYRAQGPNFLWHMDGYDKLKPFGFCIHGCIDGYSRRIMWLEVSPTNNNPAVIAKYYLECLKQIGGTARIIRSDYGTENVYVAGIQRYLRHESDDAFSGDRSYLYGKSVSNQRIEAWWSQLRRGATDWWILHFKELRDNGHYSDINLVHTECLRFCYLPVLQEELHRVARLWNVHRIRPSTNMESPNGRPDVLFSLPELTAASDHRCEVDIEDIEIAKEMCCSDLPPLHCSPEFTALAELIMMEEGLQLPRCGNEARHLYLALTSEIEKLM